jgi:hypothetical protein
MSFRPFLRCVLLSAAGLILAACASSPPPPLPADVLHPGRPPETGFDRGAGTQRVLCLRVQGEHGENWRFLVDSGSPITIFDQSLRRKLGPVIGTEPVNYAWCGKAMLQIHDAPRLFLNNTLLLTGREVWSDDLRRVWPGRGIEGILGMDCLRQYCVQLDFPHHVVRFLDPERPPGPELGRPFPLSAMNNSVFVEADLLGGGPTLYEVDTGCSVDAVMKPPFFRKAWERQHPDWVRQFPSGAGQNVVEAGFPHGTFGGETYDKLIVDAADHSFLGLRFLSRHVVTFNFPKHTMYLRRVAN